MVAASDYVSAHAGSIASFVNAPFAALGTDGFGRSDTRVALRRFSEVDRQSIVVQALQSLADTGVVRNETVVAAIERYGVAVDATPPWTR